MSFLDQITDIIKPHALAIGKVADYHGNRITNVLKNIDRGVSDLGRGGFDDEWGRAYITLPGSGAFDTIPELRPNMDQIWLLQSIVITAVPTAVGEVLTLVNDSGITLFTTGRTISTGTGTYSPLDDTVIIGGAIAILPGEHVTVTGTSGTTGQVIINYIIKNLNAIPRSANTGVSNEEYTGKNSHNPERDVVLSVNDQYESPPGPVRASNGLINAVDWESPERVDLLDPTSV
jgi:hypothetical protein